MNRSKFSVNCSIIFTELPLLERPRAAAEAGFASVEFWWPFALAKPDRRETDAFIKAVDDGGVSLTGLNFFAGDMSAGDRGILSSTSRQKEFEENVEEVRYIAEKTGCRVFNALYGNRLPTETPESQDDTALTRLAQLATFTNETGSVIVLEPLSAMETYPLITARQAMDVIERIRVTGATTNVKLLADFYHLAVNGDDVSHVISAYADEIGHVQIADAPGRNEPGTGELPILRWFDELERVGYDGLIGLEYRPSTSSTDCFEWISVAR
jgi:hydroxypyruvate isomerase